MTQVDAPPDELWRQSEWPNVLELETEEIKNKRNAIAQLEIAIRMADGILNLHHHPAYKDFANALSDMKKFRMAELLSSTTDRRSAIEQGRCLEIQGILDLVLRTQKSRESLANKLGIVQAELAELLTPKPTIEEPNDRTSDQ